MVDFNFILGLIKKEEMGFNIVNKKVSRNEEGYLRNQKKDVTFVG